jgi:hypothetical protein
MCSEPLEERKPIHKRHPQIEKHSVWVGCFRLAKRGVSIERCQDLVALELQQASKGLHDASIVVDDKYLGQ